MSGYKNIIVAIDLTDEADQVMTKAVELREHYEANLTLLHVVEPVGYAFNGDLPLDLTELQEQVESKAKARLNDLGSTYGIGSDRQILATGRPGAEIRRIAEERGADLIVLGTHGRHGIQLLLGSTANSVLHGAPTDVLSVRVR